MRELVGFALQLFRTHANRKSENSSAELFMGCSYQYSNILRPLNNQAKLIFQFLFLGRVSLCGSGWPGTHAVDQAGLKQGSHTVLLYLI